MVPDDLREELDDLKRRVETLENKLLVFPDVRERFDKGLSINDPEDFILTLIKNEPGSDLDNIYAGLLKLHSNYSRDKFDFVINEAVERGLIARKGNQLYYASETGNSKGLRTSCPFR